MLKETIAVNADLMKGSLHFVYEEYSSCPSCHLAIIPHVMHSYYVDHGKPMGGHQLYLTCQCPNCRRVFLCEYERTVGLQASIIKSVTPATPPPVSIPDGVKALSPNFYETYAQALHAESEGLLQLCGPGYRKALEYLVKDYLCHIHPESVDAIKGELLGKSIKRIDNDRLKVLAERATWLGNDATHYVQKHEDEGLDEMKRFIRAMVTYIESELAFEAASEISPK